MKYLYVALALYFFLSTPAYAAQVLTEGRWVVYGPAYICGDKQAAITLAQAGQSQQNFEAKKRLEAGACIYAKVAKFKVGGIVLKGHANVIELLGGKIPLYLVTTVTWVPMTYI